MGLSSARSLLVEFERPGPMALPLGVANLTQTYSQSAAITFMDPPRWVVAFLAEEGELVGAHGCSAVGAYDAMPSTRTVDVHVVWLRQKLEDNPKVPQLILTIRGLGYKFTG